MKIKTTSLVITLLLLLSVMTVRSQDKPPVIEVSGSAVIKVEPDIMNWTLSVVVEMDDVHDAKKSYDRSLEAVLSVLKENGVLSDKIQTSGIRISKNTSTYNSQQKKFTVSGSVWFNTSDILLYDKISEQLVAIDNIFINDINLEYSKAADVRVNARTDALNAAKKKAQEMADVFGQTIGKPLQIQEDTYTNYPNPFNVSSDLGTGDYQNQSSLFSKGTINVTAKVKVIFELLSK
ncbi:MAG: SIMPL domain-containing protein [Ignavibacteria bacterium]